jgi:uncharacterized short protein YbdD (DUF466 family)
MLRELMSFGRGMRHMAHLMVGLPDYDAYLRHMREMHPDRRPFSREEFFRDRVEARYRGGGGRCC